MNGSKSCGTFTQLKYYTAERKELLPFATAWMDLESIMLSETSQAVKDKYHDLTYKSNLISKTNKKVTRGEVGGGWIEGEKVQRITSIKDR